MKTLKLIAVSFSAFLAFSFSPAAQYVVKGKVTEPGGEPVIGAAVIPDGKTSEATVTDMDGCYSIKVSGTNSMIRFTSLGFETVEQQLNGQAVLNVIMNTEAQEMDGIPLSGRRFTEDEINRITNGDPLGVYANTDWMGLLFRKVAPTFTNNISLSGGSSNFRYFASVGAYNQQGIIPNTSYDRYNFRINLDGDMLSATK